MPHGSSVCRRRAPCKPSNVIGTSVSLRRIDRACYPHRCDAHSDTSDDTYSPTRRDAKRSRREPQEGVHTASRSVDHVARSMPASAWRTPWTVAKPKTPMVAVRWRERWRSVPNLSLAVPNPKWSFALWSLTKKARFSSWALALLWLPSVVRGSSLRNYVVLYLF